MSERCEWEKDAGRAAERSHRKGAAPVQPSGRVWASAYGVHLLTASGIFAAFAAIAEIVAADCDPRLVFFWLMLATLIDAIDGPLARLCDVKRNAPAVDGRTIDDLLDYLTFVFVPLTLVWRMEWLPEGTGWTVSLAMAASLLGFANVQAKEESEGFFRGFPSYWNIYAFYAGLLHWHSASWLGVLLLWLLAIATVSPIRMIYPNLAPPPWRLWVLGGAAVWGILLLAMLPTYPDPPHWLLILSLVYPIFYTLLSVVLDVQHRRRRSASTQKYLDSPS